MRFSTLYICYFGVREPLVQTQVLPYLREIRKDDILVSILTFEPDLKSKWTPEQIAAERSALASEGIDWHCLEYHKWPSLPATVYDLFRGVLFIRRFIATHKPDVLHGRVHLPTLMGAVARKLSRHKPKLLFDIRGFFPEEYTDAGVWPEGGWLYRGAKRVERWLLKESDGFVVLTEKAREILFSESSESGHDKFGRPVEVIPCCVDFESRFSENPETSKKIARKKLGVDDRFVLVHSGALGGLYLTDEIVDLLSVSRRKRPETFALILTQSEPSAILQRLRDEGFAESDFLVTRVAPSEIPEYLFASDVAVSFVKSSFSTLSRSPTKIAEYLACGLPLIANAGVGDVDALISENCVGALVNGFDNTDYLAALSTIESLGDVGSRCREVARREFDLKTVGGVRYRNLYRRLMKDTSNR